MQKQCTTITRECIVQRDFDIIVGGPVGPKELRASFKAGDRIEVTRMSLPGEYPERFRVEGHRKLQNVSRGVLAQFLDGFDRPGTEPGS